ncbi:BTAD domain-containing putative transcriptional regulator [Nocardia seriolae]|uniref:EmbR family transcriptional regulator n=1 Tax=Nocardia seriolae TaxID=37332 RepID=A0A0B8NA73_9NOCA|nr:BTAD domain-containing putative transcriptional regulator [Nocardia seriolae]MTJ66095.1 FHA domain-containing protein [Nocardia seriolae]MTJ74113.1 FHA domain-containing protein [Nocardia seriolae]MTJ85988.1 FHA domain-containing protein [Nocardia seriolae]MTK29982.1 FHA domain-containing protein [Nocardia seriolae]MTK44090.1 FHA domain-containing protein [Nocardia seriolae]
MGEARAQVGVLGPVQLTIGGVEQQLGGPKQRAVLAYLTINANRPVSVEALASAVWEDNPPPDGRVSLHAIVSNLRKPLRDGGIDARNMLQHMGTGYRIVVEDTACDVFRFRARRENGLRALAAGRFSAATDILSDALAQWRGPVLSDLRGLGFADAYAVALDDERIGVIEARAESDIAQGRAENVVSELNLLVRDHPLRESLWEQLITALYMTGRQSDALEAARRLRNILAEELGIDPGHRIRELESRILRQDPLSVRAVAAASATRATTIVDRSWHEPQALLRDRFGHVYPVVGSTTRIGRLSDNDIALPDGRVSRHHALIIDNGHTWVVKDLQSSNGVFINGSRVLDSGLLCDGALLRIGDTELVFVLVRDDEQE